MRKIDFHVHVTPPEISADWRGIAAGEARFAQIAESPRNRFAEAEDVVSMLDEAGFDAAVAHGFGFRDQGLCRAVNDYVIEKTRLFPGRLVGFMSVSPGQKGLEREIARCHDAGLRGVGEICPEGQRFDVDDRGQTRALVGACRERNLPISIHVNEPVGRRYPGKTDVGPRQIEKFIEGAQGVKIILAHWGGGFLFYEAMPETREKCRDVFYDVSATPFLYDESVYRAALALGLGEKILFGSDFPLLRPSRYGPAMEGLPPAARALILGGNAERLLGETAG